MTVAAAVRKHGGSPTDFRGGQRWARGGGRRYRGGNDMGVDGEARATRAVRALMGQSERGGGRRRDDGQ